MLARIFAAAPAELLVDGGYASHEDIVAATEAGGTVYAPVPKPLLWFALAHRLMRAVALRQAAGQAA